MRKNKMAGLMAGVLAAALWMTGCSGNGGTETKPAAAGAETGTETAGTSAEKEGSQASGEENKEKEGAALTENKETGKRAILVVSFGTSYNESREATIGAIEKAIAEAFPETETRRAFTSQIIIDKLKERDGLETDNVKEALDRAAADGITELVVQPTHLMHGAEYDEMMEMVDSYRDKFESVAIAEPLLGEVGSDATVINADKEAVAKAITAEAVKTAGFDSLDAAAADGTAFVFMGHGTSHTAKVSYSQMQAQMNALGYKNVFIGTVEGEPEETACENVIEAVKAAGYTKVVLRPLMVVAGDHANNDMAGDDEDSWKSQFEASGEFDSVDCQIAGLGEIADIQQLYVAHTKAAVDSLNG